MAMKMVVAYDISNDNTRSRVAALISSWGDRIQKSVYQSLLESHELTELLERIDQLINHNHDTVHVFPICSNCSNSVRFIGQAKPPSDDPYWIL
jgi:CRISPR-associated protein Cas2